MGGKGLVPFREMKLARIKPIDIGLVPDCGREELRAASEYEAQLAAWIRDTERRHDRIPRLAEAATFLCGIALLVVFPVIETLGAAFGASMIVRAAFEKRLAMSKLLKHRRLQLDAARRRLDKLHEEEAPETARAADLEDRVQMFNRRLLSLPPEVHIDRLDALLDEKERLMDEIQELRARAETDCDCPHAPPRDIAPNP